MTNVTIRLTDRDLRALKDRTGEKNAEAALKAWIGRANPKRTLEFEPETLEYISTL